MEKKFRLRKEHKEVLRDIRIYKDPRKEKELKRRLRLGLDLSGMAQFLPGK